MNHTFIGKLLPYKAHYKHVREAVNAWKAGCEFILESDSHCLNGLLVTNRIFDQSDCFKLVLRYQSSFVYGKGICKL